jgi:hypothetical protein
MSGGMQEAPKMETSVGDVSDLSVVEKKAYQRGEALLLFELSNTLQVASFREEPYDEQNIVKCCLGITLRVDALQIIKVLG